MVCAAVLAACGAAPAPRTRPNAVERAALAATGTEFGTSTGRADWVQLWTPNQVGLQIQVCVAHLTDGLIQVQVDDGPSGLAISVSYGLGGSGDPGSPISRPSVQRAIDRCVADTPIDTRRLLVPRRDWDALYSYDVTVLRRCLLEHGQRIAQVPARTQYEGLLRASTPWSPYDQVAVPDREAWFALSDACPALPPAIAERH